MFSKATRYGLSVPGCYSTASTHCAQGGVGGVWGGNNSVGSKKRHHRMRAGNRKCNWTGGQLSKSKLSKYRALMANHG